MVEKGTPLAYSATFCRVVPTRSPRGSAMRWLLTIVILLAPSTSARADEPLQGRFVDLTLIATLPGPQPMSFDLVDLRADERAALIPAKSDKEPHSFFQVKQHVGIAGGYDNGSAHGSIG